MTDAGWIGEIGPSRGKRTASNSEFTAHNSSFLAWNLMHTANVLKQCGSLPAYGNDWRASNDGARLNQPNPEHR